MLGAERIAAQIMDTATGHLGPETEVAIADLRSPKDEIVVETEAEWVRWNAILEATRAGEPLPPIEILPGEGVSIDEVDV